MIRPGSLRRTGGNGLSVGLVTTTIGRFFVAAGPARVEFGCDARAGLVITGLGASTALFGVAHSAAATVASGG